MDASYWPDQATVSVERRTLNLCLRTSPEVRTHVHCLEWYVFSRNLMSINLITSHLITAENEGRRNLKETHKYDAQPTGYDA